MEKIYECCLEVYGDKESIIAFQFRVMDDKSLLSFTKIVNEVEHWKAGNCVEFTYYNEEQKLEYFFLLNGVVNFNFISSASRMFPTLTFELACYERYAKLNIYRGYRSFRNELAMQNGKIQNFKMSKFIL